MQSKKTIFYIDPMSYRNMEEYDTALLNHIDTDWSILFFCSYLYSNEKLNNNIQINKIFKYNKIKNKFKKCISYFFSWITILYITLKVRPTVIHIQWLRVPYIDFIFIYIIRKIIKINVIYTAHNILPHNTNDKYKKIFKKIYHTVSQIIVHAEKTKNEIMHIFLIQPNMIAVIPHGILSAPPNNYQENKFVHEDTINFLIIGGISKYKGIAEFISVWHNVCVKSKEFNNSCMLHILGMAPSDYHISLCNYLSQIGDPDSIHYQNAELSNDDFNSYLLNCDVVVLPYIKISQSGVLLKSLAYKKPVLVSDVGGLGQPLEIGYIGEKFTWDKNNAEEILLKIFNNIKNKHYTSTAEWEKIHSFYSWNKIGKKTSSIYNRYTN